MEILCTEQRNIGNACLEQWEIDVLLVSEWNNIWSLSLPFYTFSSFHFPEKLFLDLMDEPNIHGAVGVHPKSAGDWNWKVEKQMRWMLEHDKVVALGEIGLDYSGT